MKHLKRPISVKVNNWDNFLLEFVESSKNTPLLYKDDNLEVKVVKTHQASKEQNKGTSWCSTSKQGFYSHDKYANMFRINFKDGYKLRLTWDYIDMKNSPLGQFSGGTHWGQGGVVNGENMYYLVIRPKDEENPFDIDYQRKDERSQMVERILSIPDEAKLAMYEYQEKLSKEKSMKLNALYKEIEKIKVVDAREIDSEIYNRLYYVKIIYNNTEFSFNIVYGGKNNIYARNISGSDSRDLDKFLVLFKNKYATHGSLFYNSEINRYIYDKIREFIKNSN